MIRKQSRFFLLVARNGGAAWIEAPLIAELKNAESKKKSVEPTAATAANASPYSPSIMIQGTFCNAVWTMLAVSHNYGSVQDAENLNCFDVTSNGFFGRTMSRQRRPSSPQMRAIKQQSGELTRRRPSLKLLWAGNVIIRYATETNAFCRFKHPPNRSTLMHEGYIPLLPTILHVSLIITSTKGH